MKKFYSIILAVFVLGLGQSYAQVSFFDDFEAYNNGDFVAQVSPDWTTWSNAPGGSEDAPIIEGFASSGNKSLAITGSPSGGPIDLVLPFGGVYNEGLFTFGMKLYVGQEKGAYMNIQAVNPIGTTWAVDFFFNSDKSLFITQASSATGSTLSGIYPQGEWMDFTVDVNLSTNIWQFFVNGNSIGLFANENNSVASLDIFPYTTDGATPEFWIDDIYYTHDDYVVPNLDLAVLPPTIKEYYLTSDQVNLTGIIKNVGYDVVNSAEFHYSINGTPYIEQLSGLNLNFLDIHEFNISQPLALEQGVNVVNLSTESPNGDTDMQPGNNTLDLNIGAIEPRPYKKILAEEMTGTWCGYCVRGTLAMDEIAAAYGDYVIPIAVHNDDPMDFGDFDAWFQSFPGFTGYPHMVVDREIENDPSQVEVMSLPRLATDPDGRLEMTATIDQASNTVTMTVHTQALTALTSNHKLAMIVTENDVTGTASGYSQANYYSGGSLGPLGGYESLPNPIPASQIEYDFVARALVGDAGGVDGSIVDASIWNVQTYEFVYAVPAEQNLANLVFVVALLNPDGSVNNAQDSSLEDALGNSPIFETNVETFVGRSINYTLYPNPISYDANVSIELTESSQVSLEVYDALGRLAASRNYGMMNGTNVIPLQASNLSAGTYLVKIITDQGFATERVVIQK